MRADVNHRVDSTPKRVSHVCSKGSLNVKHRFDLLGFADNKASPRGIVRVDEGFVNEKPHPLTFLESCTPHSNDPLQ